MKFKFLGGAMEVGRSSVLLETEGLNLVFDSGTKLTEPPTYPLPTESVNAVFLSHAHLDHCGNLPALHRQHKMPIYATPVTFELAHMIQADSMKINKLKEFPQSYTEKDMARMIEGEIHIQYDKGYRFHNKVDFTFYDAGHIPGSAGILVEAEGKSVFYTGDTHSTDTRLMNKAVYPEHADIVISESTYGNRLHPPRREVENQFLHEVESTLERGGTALIPVFAIGRTQEILLLLKDIDAKVYLDGMAKRASQTILRYPDSVKNHYHLQEAVDNTEWVKDRRQRKKITTEPSIIVTTAGMIEGGPVLDYLNHLHKDSNSSIILTGYQVEDTNGRLLVEKGYVLDEDSGRRFDVDMQISQYDFSAHSDKDELVKTIKAMNPEEIILIHGDKDSIGSLKKEFGEKRVHTPKDGESLEIV
ncbi:MAG: MBL fold metallo-hydrolase [Candidatus Altiarchaeota archaeon]